MRCVINQLYYLALLLCFSSFVFASGSTMIDLTQASEQKLWRSTNDNVMGGVSKGRLTFDSESSRFEGELSLANNGGFSSINRSIQPLPATFDTLELTFKGDGRTYQLRVATWLDGNRITYKHEFATIDAKQQVLTFKLSDFKAVFRGRLIMGAPFLKADDIKQVGVLIADKKAGPFSLELIKIEFKPSTESH